MHTHNAPRQRSISYNIREASGRLVAVHHRMDMEDGKQVWWTLPDGSKGLNGTPITKLPLYGSEHLAEWDEDDLIVLVEGEKYIE